MTSPSARRLTPGGEPTANRPRTWSERSDLELEGPYLGTQTESNLNTAWQPKSPLIQDSKTVRRPGATHVCSHGPETSSRRCSSPILPGECLHCGLYPKHQLTHGTGWSIWGHPQHHTRHRRVACEAVQHETLPVRRTRAWLVCPM